MKTKIIITDEWYTTELVKNNPKYLFVFGDNLARKGHGGQAIIRDYPNTFGIPTKREPNKRESSYFSDRFEEFIAVLNAISLLKHIKNKEKYDAIVFPSNGIGTGLSHTKNKSPIIYAMMKKVLFEKFNYTFKDTE